MGEIFTSTNLLLLLGKLHPLVVHFPIAFLLLAFLLELFTSLKKKTAPSDRTYLVLSLALISTIVAALLGWINAWNQSYSGELEDTLFYHCWSGVAVTVLVILTFIFAFISKRKNTKAWFEKYRTSLILSSVLICLSSHYGTILVYGNDYYTEIFQSEEKTESVSNQLNEAKEENVDSASNLKQVSYSEDIKPIFESSCYKCHGNGKSKGNYSLDTRERMLKGGKSRNASIIPGDSKASYLVKLVSGIIPKKIMPKKGRKLNEKEIKLIRDWIDQGASWDKETKKDEKTEKPEKVKEEEEEVLVQKTSLKLEPLAIEIDKGLNPIDEILDLYFKKHSIKLNRIDDRLFIRKVYLDTIGLLPSSAAVRTFLDNKNASKRVKLVQELLSQNQNYADHWISFWNDLLRNDDNGSGFRNNGRKAITSWLYQSLITNKPYDEFVKQLIAPSGESNGFIKGIIWRGTGSSPVEVPAMQAAQNVAQVFMGINLKCFSCHDSTDDDWRLEDAYALANVFSDQALELHDCAKPTGKFVDANFLYRDLGLIEAQAKRRQKMKQLSKIITSKENGRFYRTIINRLWAKLMGRGLIEPVDAMDESPWNEDLLNYLALDLIENKNDLKRTIELILTSKAYQMKSISNIEGDYIFKGPSIRSLTAEQFADTVQQVTGALFPLTKKDFTNQFARTLKNLRKSDWESSNLLFASNGQKIADISYPINIDISKARTLWLIVRQNKIQRNKAKKEKTKAFPVWEKPLLSFGHDSASLTSLPALVNFGAKVKRKSKDNESIIAKPFSVIAYEVEGLGFDQLSTNITMTDKSSLESNEFYIFSDLAVRAGSLPNNKLMTALGRPVRDQVVSVRESEANALQALELLVGDDFNSIIRKGSKQIQSRNYKPSEIVTSIYLRSFSRLPTDKELDLGIEVLGESPSRKNIMDLLWSVLSSPEFRLIY